VLRTARKGPRSLSRLLVVVLAASLTVFLVPSSGVGAASSAEKKMRQLINQERTERGRQALAMNDVLVGIARRHSKDMAADGRIYHSSNLGTALRFSNATAWAENVGMGASVPRLHGLFMDSTPHRKNILNGTFDRVGVGIVVRDGTLYVTVVFVAVAASRTAPSPTIVTVESGSLAGATPDASAPADPAPSGDSPPVAPDPGGTEDQPPPESPNLVEDVETIVDEVLEQAPVDEDVPDPVP
jgi:uncharacterized protein YkwD